MMDFLNIPEKCRFSTPKIIKIDHISKGQESQCQTISSIEWLGTISPVSANVTSYTDEYQSYNEIQILHICVSDTNDLYHAVKAIYRAILYPTLLVVQYKDKYLLSACAYQIGKMDSDKNILRNPAFSHWIHNDFKSDEAKLFIQKVNLQLNADGSLREIYFGILHAIQMFPLGGIGFVTWEDIENNKYHFKRYKMQSKLIIVTTAVLITVPAIIFMINDMMTGNEKMPVFKALFQSVTLRTAGFNTVDLNAMKQASVMIMIILMLIGGSPGSTAGGMKTTTFAVLMGNMVATFKRNKNIHFFERRIDNDTVKNAATIAMMYITLFVTGAFIINVTDGISLGKCLFETASAVGTVGLTLGITPQLGILSRIVLIILMFMGRVGGLTLIYAAFSGNGNSYSKFPEEKINIG